MIETISPWRSVRLRHEAAPLLKEREQYLVHLLRQGFSRKAVRSTAAYLIHIVRVMNMTALRSVELEEINSAGQLWAAYEGPHRRELKLSGSPITFVRIAQSWLRFHGQIPSPPPHPLYRFITEFIGALRSTRGLASATVHGYSSRAFGFLKWFGERHDSLEFVSLRHVDDFLASKHEAGWSLRTLATQCQSLRSFFTYAELRSAFPSHARFRRVITLAAVEWKPVRCGIVSVDPRDLNSRFGLDDAQRRRGSFVIFLPLGSVITGEVGLCSRHATVARQMANTNGFLSISFCSQTSMTMTLSRKSTLR